MQFDTQTPNNSSPTPNKKYTGDLQNLDYFQLQNNVLFP